MNKYLTEATRQELIDKSRNANVVKSYNSTRYDRRYKQHVLNSIEIFNKVDMNALFKANILTFIVPVKGETDDYSVKVIFESICDKLKDEIRLNNNQLEYKCVYKALINAINKSDVKVSCSCPDFTYRLAYFASKGGYNSGELESRPSDQTNPDDKDGAGCKHILNVIGNLDWALKLATSIYNYIGYMEENYSDKFQQLIFPKIFSISYNDYQSNREIPPDEETYEEPEMEPLDNEESEDSPMKPMGEEDFEEPEGE